MKTVGLTGAPHCRLQNKAQLVPLSLKPAPADPAAPSSGLLRRNTTAGSRSWCDQPQVVHTFKKVKNKKKAERRKKNYHQDPSSILHMSCTSVHSKSCHMASSSGNKAKAKPNRLREFFILTLGLDKQQGPPTPSPNLSSIAEPSDLDYQDSFTTMAHWEPSMQQLLQTFRQQLQPDFKSMISEFKSDIQSLVSRIHNVEKNG